VATVSFKVELGRYYTNLPPAHRRGLTNSSPAPNYAPYVDIQTTVWTPKIYVGPAVTCFTVPLTGLKYTLWAESSAVAPGDFKLIITPYIHFDRTHAGVSQSVLDCTPEQIEWVLANPINETVPTSYVTRATGFLMPPGCPQNVNGQLVASSGGRRELGDARQLTNWYPDVCRSQDPWDCLGFFPSLRLRGELPAYIVYNNPQVLNNTFTARLTDPGLGLVPVRRRQLHSVPTYNAVDCPAAYTPAGTTGAPFVGADDISYGRWLSGHTIETRRLLNTTGAFEVLLLFPAPCTRCNLYLKELWLPLQSDCGSDLTVTATVGYWSNNFSIPDHGTDSVYPGSYFTPAAHPNGATTLIHLCSTLASVVVTLGDGWSDAKLEIPFTGGLQWIGVRLRADKCFKLGKGLDLDRFTPACPNVTVTPTGLLRALRLGARTVWDAVSDTPGAFLPAARVEPWAPFCVPYPSPSHGAGPSSAATPTRTPSRSSTFSVGPLYQTGEILQPGFTTPAPGAPGWAGSGGANGGGSWGSSDSNSHNVSGLSAGGIVGVVIGCVVAGLAVVVLAVYAGHRRRAAQMGSIGAAAAATTAAAGSVAAAAPGATALRSQAVTDSGAASAPAGAGAATGVGGAASTAAASSTREGASASATGVATPAAGRGTDSPARQRRPPMISP